MEIGDHRLQFQTVANASFEGKDRALVKSATGGPPMDRHQALRAKC